MATLTVDEDAEQPAYVTGRERSPLYAPVYTMAVPVGHEREDSDRNRLAVERVQVVERVHFRKVTHKRSLPLSAGTNANGFAKTGDVGRLCMKRCTPDGDR